jgi:flavin reductase (DIM6/NTAB) family NADH-FMN oxidoreductase RutF
MHRRHRFPGGDHEIVVGRVRAIETADDPADTPVF